MFKKICEVLSWIMIMLLVVVALSLLLPRVFGCETMAVVSGSMEPGISVGSVVITYPVENSEDLVIGDVITYEVDSGTRVTHRITGINKETQEYTTKGDANNSEDPEPVRFAQIVGKMKLSIPLLGYLSIYVKTPLGIAVAAVVSFILILLLFLPELFGKDKKKNS